MSLIINTGQRVHDFNRGAVRVAATEAGTPVMCYVSDEALQDHSGSQSYEPFELVGIFDSNTAFFAGVIKRKHLAGQTESDGSIVVSSHDIR